MMNESEKISDNVIDKIKRKLEVIWNMISDSLTVSRNSKADDKQIYWLIEYDW